MDDIQALHDTLPDHLVSVINASLKVRRRHQFFLWVQGVFQSLLPHDVLLCASADIRSRTFNFDHFSIAKSTKYQDKDLFNADNGIVPHLLSIWESGRFRPLIMDTARLLPGADPKIHQTLARFQFSRAVAHGTFDAGGAPLSFFVLLQSDPVPMINIEYKIEFITPFLCTAYHRSLLDTVPPPTERSVSSNSHLLTARQAEILRWVQQGKSNAEIGDILNISSLTVKNHVQRILRRLNVQNRAQAAAKGLSMNIVKSQFST